MSSNRILHGVSSLACRSSLFSARGLALRSFSSRAPTRQNPSARPHQLIGFSCEPITPFSLLRLLNTSSSKHTGYGGRDPLHDADGEISDGWDEEDEEEPKLGDGGDGGGIVLLGVPWGQRALSIAQEVLLQFGNEIQIFAFKTTPRGYIYVRLDKISEEYGSPSMEELEKYSKEYRKKLDEVGALGEIPDDLALEVSSPGGERLLKIPDDLIRFKDMPMRVCYIEDMKPSSKEKVGFFELESIEMESGSCVWMLADVKENQVTKGRPLSRKQEDWRLNLPYSMLRRVNLYFAQTSGDEYEQRG